MSAKGEEKIKAGGRGIGQKEKNRRIEARKRVWGKSSIFLEK